IRFEHPFDVIDRRRLGVDQGDIIRKLPYELLTHPLVFAAKLVELGAEVVHSLGATAFGWRGQQIVEKPEPSRDLLDQILFVTRKFGQPRMSSYGPGARLGKRILHRATTDRIGKTEPLNCRSPLIG